MIKKFLATGISVLLTLVAAELGLRTIGYKPGVYVSEKWWFHEVDSLIELRSYAADSQGQMRVSANVAPYVNNQIVQKVNQKNYTPFKNNELVDDLVHVINSYSLLHDSSFSNDFKKHIKQMQTSGAMDEVDSAIMQYASMPINADGFRSIPFQQYRSSKKKVLLLGDSFTWGLGASNLTNSFADLLLAKGYAVYNSGIVCTDPAQYLAVAKKYIPLLQPDFVIVNFCLANDVVYFKRELIPFKPALWCTNAGYLLSCPQGVYFNNAKEAYEFNRLRYFIPAEKNAFNAVCSKLVLGTLLWKALNRFNWVDAIPAAHEWYEMEVKKMHLPEPYTNIQIDSIRTISAQSGSKFLVAIIPIVEGSSFSYPDSQKNLFENIPYANPSMSVKYLTTPDAHFNDLGNKMYANFLDSLIKANQ